MYIIFTILGEKDIISALSTQTRLGPGGTEIATDSPSTKLLMEASRERL